MARSHRKTAIRGIAGADSDKTAKRKANRVLRANVRRQLKNYDNYDRTAITHLKEVSSPWTFPKDGKKYFDKEEHPHDMRK